MLANFFLAIGSSTIIMMVARAMVAVDPFRQSKRMGIPMASGKGRMALRRCMFQAATASRIREKNLCKLELHDGP